MASYMQVFRRLSLLPHCRRSGRYLGAGGFHTTWRRAMPVAPPATPPMATMKAFGQLTFGGPEVLQELRLPVPEATGADLRVRVRALSVNPVDVKVRENAGGYGERQGPAPTITGWDCAGVVDAVGPDADGRFKVGDEVFFAGSAIRRGCNAEWVAVDSRIVGRKPATLTFAEAAALPLTSLTAWEGLIDQAGIQPHTATHQGPPPTILIVGGAGGVGSIGIQIAKRHLGATVVATASRPETVAHCRALGADHVVDHRKDLRAEVRALGLREVSHVLHCAEPDENFTQVAELLAPFGRFVCIRPLTANTAGLFSRGIAVVYEMMFARSMFGVNIERQGQILDKVADLVDAGVLKSTLVETLPWTLEDLRTAHLKAQGGRGIGKTVLVVAP